MMVGELWHHIASMVKCSELKIENSAISSMMIVQYRRLQTLACWCIVYSL